MPSMLPGAFWGREWTQPWTPSSGSHEASGSLGCPQSLPCPGAGTCVTAGHRPWPWEGPSAGAASPALPSSCLGPLRGPEAPSRSKRGPFLPSPNLPLHQHSPPTLMEPTQMRVWPGRGRGSCRAREPGEDSWPSSPWCSEHRALPWFLPSQLQLLGSEVKAQAWWPDGGGGGGGAVRQGHWRACSTWAQDSGHLQLGALGLQGERVKRGTDGCGGREGG